MNESNQNPSFLQKLFYCCMSRNPDTDINDLNLQRKAKDIIHNIAEKISDSILLFDRKYICDDEINKITFTKEGIFNFINKIRSLNYTITNDNDGIKISTFPKSDLTDSIPIIRCEVQIPKSRFTMPPPILDIARVNYSPEERLKWDKNIKSYDLINKISSDTSISKLVTNKIAFVINERETYDKRCEFMDDGVYYSFSTSIPDDFFPPQSEPVRVKNYFGIFVIWDDLNNFYFDSINQIDVKNTIPVTMITSPLPLKTKDFYDTLVSFFNSMSEE